MAVKNNHDVIFEEQESMYKSEKESPKHMKSHLSIQPSNPGQSKKSYRKVESQLNLNSAANRSLVKNDKVMSSTKNIKLGKLRAIIPSSVKKLGGGQTFRRNNSEKMVGNSKSRSNSTDRS